MNPYLRFTIGGMSKTTKMNNWGESLFSWNDTIAFQRQNQDYLNIELWTRLRVFSKKENNDLMLGETIFDIDECLQYPNNRYNSPMEFCKQGMVAGVLE